MSGYTHRNIEDLEDVAVKGGFSPDLEARFAREELGSEQVGISYQRFAPGFRQPFAHTHGTDEEIYVVIEGSGRMMVGAETLELRRLDAVRVAPETVRAFEAGPDGLTVLAVGPNSTGDAKVAPAEWPD
jgi:quercetin dioxygenase-like cupin family protein